MASNNVTAVSAFIEGAPPGELTDVVNDVKALTASHPTLLETARPAFQKYHEEQLTAAKLPGSEKSVLVSEYNALGNGRYFDVESGSEWSYDHVTQRVSDVRSYTVEGQDMDLITSLQKPFTLHAHEHYPTSTTAIVPAPSSPQDSINLLLTSSKYSPSNFWNGRLRTVYHYNKATQILTGTLKCDVHYYEDGNVRLLTSKTLPETIVSGGPGEIVMVIARTEKAWQEELNRDFARLSEGEFKGLRRQLPVTRQKMEWEKIGSYRGAREIGSGRR